MASQLATLHSKATQAKLPWLSSTRVSPFSRSIAMKPQPPPQPLSPSSSAAAERFWNFPRICTDHVQMRRNVAVKSHLKLNLPLFSPHDQLGNWAVLTWIGVLGLWSEQGKIGSGALVSTLLGLAASKFGIIASDAPTFSIFMDFSVKVAIPLLLFRVELHSFLKSTGTILLAFLLGSVGTTIGTLVAYSFVPMRSLGRDSWKIAAALMGMHIGGAVNYVDISDAFDVSSSAFVAGLAVDKVICALYCATLFALASKVALETTTVNGSWEVNEHRGEQQASSISEFKLMASLAVSCTICIIGQYVTKYFGIPGGSIPAITIVTVVLTTFFRKPFAYLAHCSEAMAMIIMQVSFAVMGARGNIWSVVNAAPSTFMFSLVQVAVHLAITVGLGKLLRCDLKSLLLASNASIVDPTTACVWPQQIVGVQWLFL